MAGWALRTLQGRLARRGLEIRRHPATRRQAMFSRYQVDLVFDVGAASGAYGRQLRSFGYGGRIISFEPLAHAFEELSVTIEGDPSWTAENVALGRDSGPATINVASNSDSSSLLPMLDAHRQADPSVHYVGQEQIQVERLDEIAPRHLQPDARAFLKIDAQGFEREVLDGAEDTLQHCVGLQVELSFVPLYERGMLADETLGLLYGRGYQLVGFEQGLAAPTGEILQADGVFFRTAGSKTRSP